MSLSLGRLFVWASLLFLVVGAVSAYDVGSALTIRQLVHYDNGSAVVPLTSNACIASVFLTANNSFVVWDEAMAPDVLGYHSFVMTPGAAGTYTVSVLCSYNGSSATYYEDFVASVPSTGAPASGQVLVLNSKIVPEKTSFVVNLGVEPRLQARAQYFVNDQLANANSGEWLLMFGDSEVDSGRLVIEDLGSYLFDYDFKDKAPGEYMLLLRFDGKTSIVGVTVFNVGKDAMSIRSLVSNDDGTVSVMKASIAVIIAVLLIITLIMVWWRIRRK